MTERLDRELKGTGLAAALARIATSESYPDAARLDAARDALTIYERETERLRERIHEAVNECQRRCAHHQATAAYYAGLLSWARTELAGTGERWRGSSHLQQAMFVALAEDAHNAHRALVEVGTYLKILGGHSEV
jgi:hypothetical protein